jgi:hypothetical protein
MEVNENGFSMGHFRWSLAHPKPIVAHFKASDIFWPTLPEDFDMVYVTRATDVKLAANMTSSPWVDVADLVAKGHLTALQHGEEKGEDFLGIYRIVQYLICKCLRVKNRSSPVIIKYAIQSMITLKYGN